MKKLRLVLVLLLYLSLYTEGSLFAEFDDLDRSFKDLERSIKQDSLKDLQIQKDYTQPQQPMQTIPQETSPLQFQKIKPFSQSVPPKDRPATDKAILKNQERFKKMMAEQRKKITDNLADWGIKIPKQYRFIVDLFVIAICVTLLGLIFYRRTVKKEEEAKVVDEEQGPDDEITFYDPNASKDKF